MTRLHPLSAAVSALRSGGQLALFALFASTAFLGMGGDGVSPALIGVVPLAFLVGAGFAAVRWYRFEYEVLPEHLLVRSGVFSRQEREIPLRRIQNVDIRRSVLQRALGLATVRVETAGGSSTEATLDAVAVDDAERLREDLGARGRAARGAGRAGESERAADDGDTAGPAAAATDDRETLYELTGRRFATLCAVSFRPSAVLAPFVGASVFDDVILDAGRLLVRFGIIDVDVGPADVPSLGLTDLLYLAAIAVGSFLLVVWVVSGLLTFVRYYGFRLERVGDELRYERGLLGRYSGTVPLSKVQTVTVSENAAMRRLGYARLAVDTAGASPGSNGDDGGAETAVPLDSRERVVELADDLRATLEGDAASWSTEADLDDAFGEAVVDRPPERARRRYVVRYALAAVALAAVAVAVDRTVFGLPAYLPLAPLAGVLLAPLAGHLTWANRGYATVDDGLVTRTGVLRRHTRLVPYFRLQTVFVSRTVFQRRRDLASVVGDSASSSRLLGGDATAHDVDAAEADDLREELLARLRSNLAARRRRTRRQRRFRAGGGDPDADGDGADVPFGDDRPAGNGRTAGGDGAASTGRGFEWVDPVGPESGGPVASDDGDGPDEETGPTDADGAADDPDRTDDDDAADDAADGAADGDGRDR
ncbi:PH domain-containing protein [Halobaculum lipolyticum]|uniref:PH domain-containing protein n=1 Tax=Halobaculum lipolyticum TaxID=3032001 RepID=A0ABD5WCH3_9EURY|nr:PH domain-containing protein [Halobaculum sp. DT31]